MNILDEATNDWTEILPDLPAERLHAIAGTYGGKRCRTRDECLRHMLGLLADPEAMRKVVEGLPLRDRQVLQNFSRFRGLAGPLEVALTIAACGLHDDSAVRGPNTAMRYMASLVERGLVLECDPLRRTKYRSPSAPLCVDPRVMQWAGDDPSVPIELETVTPPAVTHYRRPHEVLFMLEDFHRQVSRQGGLALTQARRMRAPDRGKLARALGWDDIEDLGALPFPGLLDEMVHALWRVGVLELVDARLRTCGSEGHLSVVAWAERAVLGFLTARGWLACEQQGPQMSNLGGWMVPPATSRLVLMVGIGALDRPDEFHRVSDLSQALFARVGPDYFESYLGTQARLLSRPPVGKERDKVLQDGWARCEHVLIECALGTWLHAAGVVEVGLQDGHVETFRLTKMGLAMLSGASRTPKATGRRDAWVVQPNLEIIAWLDRAEADDLGVLECYGERTQVRDHTVHYSLSRQSVHAGLERGGTADELLERLAAGSQAPLPQNVVAEINEWVQVRDRLVLRRGAHLLEFASQEERDAALAAGLPGRPLGALLLLLPDTPPELKTIAETLKTEAIRFTLYNDRPARSVRIEADGSSKVVGSAPDLQTTGLLDRWCECHEDGARKLTEASVRRAVESGALASELDAFLRERAIGRVPGLLQIAVRGWSGRKSQMSLEPSTLIRCKDARQRTVLLDDKVIRECAIAPVGDDSVLVAEKDLPSVMERLKWAGVEAVTPEGTVAKSKRR